MRLSKTSSPLFHMFRINEIPGDAKLRQFFSQATFGKRVFCPRCSTSHIKCSEDRYRCSSCRRPFSLTSASWLGCTKLSLRQIWILLAFVGRLNIPCLQLQVWPQFRSSPPVVGTDVLGSTWSMPAPRNLRAMSRLTSPLWADVDMETRRLYLGLGAARWSRWS